MHRDCESAVIRDMRGRALFFVAGDDSGMKNEYRKPAILFGSRFGGLGVHRDISAGAAQALDRKDRNEVPTPRAAIVLGSAGVEVLLHLRSDLLDHEMAYDLLLAAHDARLAELTGPFADLELVPGMARVSERGGSFSRQ